MDLELPTDVEGYDTPDLDTLQEWIWDGVAEALDGCPVEPDGECEHLQPSWLTALNLL